MKNTASIFPQRCSPRRRGYDYTLPGLYFVTICVEGRRCLLGDVISAGSISLSTLGSLVEEEWLALPGRYDRVLLHEFVFMPNHMHGIIELRSMEGQADVPVSLSQVIAYFKYQTSKRAGLPYPLWQRSFYDVIIRDLDAYRSIASYILENPRHWPTDDLHP